MTNLCLEHNLQVVEQSLAELAVVGAVLVQTLDHRGHICTPEVSKKHTVWYVNEPLSRPDNNAMYSCTAANSSCSIPLLSEP